jgi:uncharacterized protein
MAGAEFRFYGALNDFLPAFRRRRTLVHRFADRPAVKDGIEALGVPHPEVALLTVNGTIAPFEHRICDGDRVAVYPTFRRLDVPAASLASPPPAGVPRFVLDVHLRRLALHLRLLGLDALWREDADDPELAATSAAEGRILLTRDLGLLKRAVVRHGAFVRATSPPEQLHEIADRFSLEQHARPFTRCMRCNGDIRDADPEEVRGLLEEGTRSSHDVFRLCTGCGRAYWRGAHFGRLCRLVRSVMPGWVEKWGHAGSGSPPAPAAGT